MNSSEQVTNVLVAKALASAGTLVKNEFPLASVDFSPWRDDPLTKLWHEENSLDLSLNFPGEQSWHVRADVAGIWIVWVSYRPRAQDVHSVDLVFVEYFPLTQSMHDVSPAALAYRPGAQSLQFSSVCP